MSSYLVFSTPKSGTHLLAKILTQFPYVEHSGVHLSRQAVARFADDPEAFLRTATFGYDMQGELPWIKRLLRSLGDRQFLTAHIPPYTEFRGLLDSLGFKVLVIERDPRDVVVSWADYICREQTHALHGRVSRMSDEERITSGIRGMPWSAESGRGQPAISELIERHLGWKGHSGALVVRYEALIGERGAGTREVQIATLREIGGFLGTPVGDDRLSAIADGAFGGTYTFNTGVVGRWRQRFTETHKALFKAEAGALLIRLGYERDHDW